MMNLFCPEKQVKTEAAGCGGDGKYSGQEKKISLSGAKTVIRSG